MTNWIKQWLTIKAGKGALDRIATSVEELLQAVENNDSNIQKGLRRLSLAQRQQSEVIDTLTEETRLLKSAIADRYGVTLNHRQLLHTLDNLNKVNHAANNHDFIAPLVLRAIEELLAQCGLEPVAVINQPYSAQDCEVLSAIEDDQQKAGCVYEILQQGYRTANGQLVRPAKVIVYREPQQQGAKNQTEETHCVD